MPKTFSIEESLKFGWQKTKANSMILFQIMLTLFAVQVVSSIVSKVLENTLIGFFAALAVGILGIFLQYGFVVIVLKLARGEATTYRDIIPKPALVWKLFLAGLLVGVLTLAGLILLIIPGIYFALRFSMTSFAIIDGAGIMESFEKSTKLTDGHKWQLLGLFVVFALINIVGFLLFIVGLLVTVPVTMIGIAHVYQSLKSQSHEAPAAIHEHTHDHNHEGHEHHDHDHSDPNHTH